MDGFTIPALGTEEQAALAARAARHGRTPEEEARAILREALAEGAEVPLDLPRAASPEDSFGSAIRKIVEKYGGFELELPPRGPMREPPDFSNH